MSVQAYVFIETDHGKAKDVNNQIRKLSFVKRCHVVTGPYDLVALIDAPDISTLGEDLVAKLQIIPGVIKSLSNIVVG
ncbi:MAG: Lrp/AsnC family transcriptional regulator [Chlamydiota bacterium]|nr:Lrp/AsnC family transcriptional regulator [Chlamydiota bacterium]